MQTKKVRETIQIPQMDSISSSIVKDPLISFQPLQRSYAGSPFHIQHNSPVLKDIGSEIQIMLQTINLHLSRLLTS